MNMKNRMWNRKMLRGPLVLWQNSYQNYCCRRMSSSMLHQFKKQKTFFYPDRREETERMAEQTKGQLVADPNSSENGRQLPKDFYYQVLGVTRDATTMQIKAAFHALAKRYHPDANKTGTNLSKRFQDISNAYRVLVDEAKRQEYDKSENEKERLQQTSSQTAKNLKKFLSIGQTSVKGSTTPMRMTLPGSTLTRTSLPNPLPGTTPMPPTSSIDMVPRSAEYLKMANVTPTLELTFLEAIHGIKKIIEVKCLVKCPSCNGKSNQYSSRTESEPCRKCHGTGKTSRKTATYTSMITCDQCNGKRYINRNQCDLCDCRGFVHETLKLPVNVPHGCKTGDIISVHNPRDNQDINYRIQVKENNYYKRIGANIFTDKYITITQAILGGTFKVRGVYGDIEIKVDPGTESHTQIRIPGKGVRSGESYGDHIITVKVLIPKQLNVKQRQLILSLAKTEDPIFESAT